LWSCQPDAGRIVHGFAHPLNQLLNLTPLDFGGPQNPRVLPEHSFTDLNNLQPNSPFRDSCQVAHVHSFIQDAK
jgi:hypothetical protein